MVVPGRQVRFLWRSGDRLNRQLSKLPQEIYDEIYNLVFTAVPATVHIDKHYKPPAQLRVHRAGRKKFFESHYGGEDMKFTANAVPAYCETPPWTKCDLSARCTALLEKLSTDRVQVRSHACTFGVKLDFGKSRALETIAVVTMGNIMEAKLHTVGLTGSVKLERYPDYSEHARLAYQRDAKPGFKRKRKHGNLTGAVVLGSVMHTMLLSSGYDDL